MKIEIDNNIMYSPSCSTVKSIRIKQGYLAENDVILNKNKLPLSSWKRGLWSVGHLYIEYGSQSHHCILEWDRESRRIYVTDSCEGHRDVETRRFHTTLFEVLVAALYGADNSAAIAQLFNLPVTQIHYDIGEAYIYQLQ
jgi:hypothetical protein